MNSRTGRHCKLAVVLIASYGLSCTACLAATIEGNEYPIGTAFDNEFVPAGAVLSAGLGYVTFANDDFVGIFGTAPGSAWAGVAGASFSAPIQVIFVVPGNASLPGVVNGTISARYGDGGGDLDSLRLRALDIHNQSIG